MRRNFRLGVLSQGGYEAETLVYKANVEASGGAVQNIARVDKVVKLIKKEGLWNNLHRCHLGWGGMILRNDGGVNRIRTLFDLSIEADIENPNSNTTQPKLVGDNITFEGGQWLFRNINITSPNTETGGSLIVSMRSNTKERLGIVGAYLDRQTMMIVATSGRFHYGGALSYRANTADVIANDSQNILAVTTSAVSNADAMYVNGVKKTLITPTVDYRTSLFMAMGCANANSPFNPTLLYTGTIKFAMSFNTKLTDQQVTDISNAMALI